MEGLFIMTQIKKAYNMKSFKHNISNFLIRYPENWEIKKEDNIINLFNPSSGFGAIQFSIYYVDNPINIESELDEYIKSRHEKYEIFKETNSLSNGLSLDNDGRQWQYWLYKKDNFLIFASYNCAIEDIGKDGNEIKAIIENTFT